MYGSVYIVVRGNAVYICRGSSDGDFWVEFSNRFWMFADICVAVRISANSEILFLLCGYLVR